MGIKIRMTLVNSQLIMMIMLKYLQNFCTIFVQVFPVDIEDEAKERAWKRHPAKSPPFNKVTREYWGV